MDKTVNGNAVLQNSSIQLHAQINFLVSCNNV